MGWTGHKLGNGYTLFTRGGLRGVFIQPDDGGYSDDDINIPYELLLSLAADEIRSFKIGQLEQMDDNVVLGISVK